MAHYLRYDRHSTARDDGLKYVGIGPYDWQVGYDTPEAGLYSGVRTATRILTVPFQWVVSSLEMPFGGSRQLELIGQSIRRCYEMLQEQCVVISQKRVQK